MQSSIVYEVLVSEGVGVPWLDTTIPSTPWSIASSASYGRLFVTKTVLEVFGIGRNLPPRT